MKSKADSMCDKFQQNGLELRRCFRYYADMRHRRFADRRDEKTFAKSRLGILLGKKLFFDFFLFKQ